MKGPIFFLFMVLTGVFSFENSNDFINEINNKQNFWKAGRNFHEDTPISTIRMLLGSKPIPQEIAQKIPVMKHDMNADDIPKSFDLRSHWSNCKTIKEVRDQSSCGSCWAVSTASAISDRICIHSKGKLQPEISARHLMSCDNLFQEGCYGGIPWVAFEFWIEQGIVTGGSYESNSGCQPYPFPSCEHKVNGSKPQCPSETYPTPQCQSSCDNSTIDFQNNRFFGASEYKLEIFDEHGIQAEILKNGPVVATFTVYTDFIHYKSGVYVKTSGKVEGYHAVRVIGWGVENGIKYWLVVNSWNEDWGNKGLFKIRRGTNECGFELEVIAGIPK